MKIFTLLFVVISYNTITAQHLPLQIGNQWHYNGVVGFGNYAAIAVDTLIINDKTYFEIERRYYSTGQLLMTTYDHFEGDSIYYRIINGEESLIINFNWPDGYTQVTQIDSNCIELLLMHKELVNVWGFDTDVFKFWFGSWCTGWEDTSWTLTPFKITRLFGSYWANDGELIGAIINGIIYGNLHPLPVELASFNAKAEGNNVMLNWVTATEINNQGFEIQRCQKSNLNNQNWKVIEFVSGYGTTTGTKFYSYSDENLYPGKYQYRLKQVDFDGSFEYSNVIEVELGIPGQFALYQNYPNPFNPYTIIHFGIPKVNGNENVLTTLKVYDVLGNEVAVLINEERSAGYYKAEFDASQLSSGIYLYELRWGNFVQSKKMILMK